MANTDITRRKPLVDKLYKNEDLFRAIAACTPDHIIVQDNDLRYTYVINPQLGLTEKDMLGKTDYDFLSKEEAEKLTLIKKEVINTGKQVKCETFLTSKDGKKEFFDGVYIPRFDLDSKVAGLIGYFRNRTEHKLIENTLVESEKSLNAAQSLAQIGSWQWTMATDTVKWSEELCLINGHDPRLPPPGFAEMSSFYTPESWARLIEVVTKALNSGESYELFLDLVRTDGNIRKTLSRGLADYDVIGKITGLHGTVQDITERKLVEEKLESEHSILTALINSTGDTIIFTLDRRYCYTAFNEKHREEMKRIWNAEIKTGMNLLDCMQIPELRESAKQSIDRALTGEVLSEIQHQPEHNIYYELNWNPIWQNKEIVGVTALIKDITKKKQAEEALKVNEALFREYYDNMKSGSAIFTVINDGSKGSDYIIKKINRVGLKMEGKELEAVVGKRFIDIRPTIDSYGLIPVMKKVWETGESANFPTRIYIDERCSNYYENYVFKLPSGEVVTLYNDVTESKKAEEALRESEERFRMVASNTPDHILIQDDQLQYTLVINPQLGLTVQDMIGKTDYDFLSKEDAENLTRIKRKVIDTGKQVKCEIYLTSKDGKKEFFDGAYIPRFDINGKCVGLIGYFKNITERKNAEEQIKTILRTTIDGFYLVDCEGRILDTNDSYCRMIGYSREEMTKMKVKDIEAVDTEEVIKKKIQRILKTGYARFETKHRRKDGTVIDVEASVNYLIEEQPKLFCFMRDISDRKEAEEKLIEKESDLNHAQKIANIGSWKFDNKTQIPVWSENMYHIFGLNPENGPLDYPGHKKIIYPDDWEEFDNAVQLASGTGEGYKLNIRIRRPSGELRWIITECETKKDPEGNVVQIFGVCQDITESRLLEDELRKREARYSAILQTALDGFWVTDLQGNFLDVNESYCHLIGYNHDELLTMNISDVEVLEKKTKINQRIQRFIENGSDRFESKHRCKDGNMVDLDISVNYLPSEAKLFVFLHDITARNLGKAALQESEERYRQLVEGSPDAIAVHLNGKIVFVNSAAAKLIGAKNPQELIGSPVLNVIHSDSKSHVIERLRLESEGKEAPLIEEKFVKFDGSVIDVEVVGLPYPYLGQTATQVVVRDITERKLLENKAKEKISEIERFNNLMIGREFRMIELKKEINELLVRLGEKKKYRIPK